MLAFLTILLLNCFGSTTGEKTTVISNEIAVAVNPAHFLEASLASPVTTVPCTLSDGTKSTCYKIVAGSAPSDHQMGPWCPENIADGAEAGGIWMEGGEVFDVDGYGLYAYLDESGKAPTDLDDCRGHYDEVRGYHYHVDKAGSNNFINCLRGAYAK
ncbi:MAG: hypothetical protein AB8H12_05390 [Lewinella sp.]